jgi:stearoyl-CoA desaturase (delta-9 desaturase)
VKNVNRVEWDRAIPYAAVHVLCLGVFWVGWSVTAVSIAGCLYALRVFVLTGFYHRYFSHRAFKTSRAVQFSAAAIGCTAFQCGPIWWASHHRHHHIYSDEDDDLHSPRRQGFWWSHMGWFLGRRARDANHRLVPDLERLPELRFLDRFHVLPGILLGIALFAAGDLLAIHWPELNTSGAQLLVWGLFISTVCVYHVTYLVNSATHLIGRRRYITKDDSRNNLWIALLTFGEGWHNNHHHYPNSARQGFFWWEIDLTYYILLGMSRFRLVWDLRPVPPHALNKNLEPQCVKSCDLETGIETAQGYLK